MSASLEDVGRCHSNPQNRTKTILPSACDKMDTTDTVDAPLTRVEQPNGALTVNNARTEFRSKAELERVRRHRQAQKAYGRGRQIDVKNVRDKKLRRNLTNLEKKYKTAALKAKEAEILLENSSGFLEAETELERTYKVRQDDIQKEVGIDVAQKKFELKLNDLGPYVCEYSRNGRDLILAGRKGHIATMDWREGKLGCELQLGETVRDARFLHNNQFFAVAQKKYVYIYDANGVELHCLKKHVEVSHMEFLPYHFLLATLVSNLDNYTNRLWLTTRRVSAAN
jgi:U3 small nucleolar RNA-associated protein 7